jgi:hypothetical protein
MLKRIGVLTSLAVVAVMFAGVSSAQAATAGVCVFSGLAGELTPIQNAQPDLEDLGQPGNPLPAPLDFEQGGYKYGHSNPGGATCGGVLNGNLVVPSLGNGTITSDGYYDNIICGTGFAHDIDGSDTHLIGAGNDITGVGYQIPFVAGVGPLLIADGAPNLAGLLAPNHGAGANDDETHADASTTDPNTGLTYTGAGLVQITPGAGTPTPQSIQDPTHDNCVNHGAVVNGDTTTDEFEVKGFLIAAGL